MKALLHAYLVSLTFGRGAVPTPYTPYLIESRDGTKENSVIIDVLPAGYAGTPDIPRDCQIWTNGCVDCVVKNG